MSRKSSSRSPLKHRPVALTAPENETLQQLCDRLRLQSWDVLLIGDGSGTTWDAASGWAGVLIDRRSNARLDFFGGVNLGSINFAELMPYFQALLWYDHYYRDAWKSRQEFLRVTIVTDHQALVDQSRQAADNSRPLPAAQEPLWAAFRQLHRMGYLVQFVWFERETSAINCAADGLSKRCRKTVVDMQEALTRQQWLDDNNQPVSVYNIAPSA